jgi:hypothetical protein
MNNQETFEAMIRKLAATSIHEKYTAPANRINKKLYNPDYKRNYYKE